MRPPPTLCWQSAWGAGNPRLHLYDHGMSVLVEGRTIAGLRIGRLLGHGAMGEVYRADQLVLARAVAVKRILPQFAGSPGAVERLAREARALASVKSPYVVQVHDLVQADGEILLVMELIEGGGSLRPWCGRLAWTEACALTRHLAEALAAAHAAGVIHRDVKPDNALLAADGSARLGDFGLARALDAAQLTAAGSVVGTPAYLAPECRDGSPGGQPADVYSLGCTWFHLLTGQPPYRGSDVRDLLRRHAEEAPPDPTTSVIGLDPTIARLLASCLAKRAEDRPSAAAIAAALAGNPRIPDRLRDIPHAIPTALAPTLTPATSLAPNQTPATAPTALPATAPTVTAPLAKRPRRWLVPAIGVGVLIVLGLVVAMAPARQDELAVVRKLAEIGQIAEARARITALVERDPTRDFKPLVREVDLAEARQLWRTGREKEGTTAYRDLLRNHPGDLVAAAAVIEDLPEFEPPTLEAVLKLPALTTPKQIAVAWRWIVPANRTADYYAKLAGLIAALPGAESDARQRLGDKDEDVRAIALDLLERMQRGTDADRIRYHTENMVRLSSSYGIAREAVAWLQAESAKAGWQARLQAATLPPFSDILAMRSDDEHGAKVEKLLQQAFPGQVRPQLSGWLQHEDDTVRQRAARLAAALAPAP